METIQPTPPENESARLSNEARSYFLQQGKSIGRIYDILDSNIVMHHVKSWFSVLLELLLYGLFVVIIFLIATLPSYVMNLTFAIENELLGEELSRLVKLDYTLEIKAITEAIFYARLVLLLVSIPVLGMAIILRRNRKKRRLMREAFFEVLEMRKNFDYAVKNLKL